MNMLLSGEVCWVRIVGGAAEGPVAIGLPVGVADWEWWEDGRAGDGAWDW